MLNKLDQNIALAVVKSRLVITVGVVSIESLEILSAHYILLVVVVIVYSMISCCCPVVQNVSWSKFLVPVAIYPTSIARFYYISRPRLIAQIIYILVDLAMKSEQRNAGLVGNGYFEANRKNDLHGGLWHIVG